MTNLLSLHRDVLIYILDKLEEPELLNMFKSNKELKDKYCPYFSEKIKDYQEYLKYQKEVAIPKKKDKLDFFMEVVQLRSDDELIGIPNVIAQFMGLGHMPKDGEYTIYTKQFLLFWFLIYFSNQESKSLDYSNVITINDEIANLIGEVSGTNMTLREVIVIFYSRMIRIGPNKLLSDSDIIQFANEHCELMNLISFVRKRFFRFWYEN